jgi:uncharacterized protein YbjQ (UPF0145 family)
VEIYEPGALEQVREESIRQLDGGGLPVLAERRLAALFGSSAERFTTHLSVSEFALTRSVGLRPLSQVMGACVYHAKFALDRFAVRWTAEGGRAYRLPGAAEPWNAARERALDRMLAEARLCAAHAVVGVSIRQAQKHSGRYDATVECVASGTAVARTVPVGAPPGPVLTNLSAQDYWKLLQQGFAPVGVVASTTVYGCKPSVESGRAEVSSIASAARRRTREIPEFSDGLRLAHRVAFTHMHAQAERMGAEGIVGVTIYRDLHAVTPQSRRWHDLIVVVHAIGTAIARRGIPPASGNRLTITPVRHLDEKGRSAP